MNILAVDPGNVYSAYVLVDEHYNILDKGKVENDRLLGLINLLNDEVDELVVEKIANMGMAVGATVFDTCIWIGRFWQASKAKEKSYVYRKDEKMNLCGSMRAKDSNIRQALIDRFGEVGTKNKQGYFYGFKADMWAAYAVAVTYLDMKGETK